MKSYALDLFISHSARDKRLAEKLIEFLRAAMAIPTDRVRCTSVDGYKLPGGARTESKLRMEIKGAQCFIGLITPDSLKSQFVLFELGARWGLDEHLIPILGGGMTAGELQPPLSNLNALNSANKNEMEQLVHDLAKIFEKQVPTSAIYRSQLSALTDQKSQKMRQRDKSPSRTRQGSKEGKSEDPILTGTPQPQVGTVPSVILGAIPDLIRRRIAKESNKPVGQITESDIMMAKKLDLHWDDIVDSDLNQLPNFTALQSLNLEGTKISDAGLKSVERLTALQSLNLRNTEISDIGLKSLENLTAIQSLNLRNTNISDAGLKSLENLTALQSLDLWSTNICDAGLKSLENLTMLQSLRLVNTKITSIGLTSLEKLTTLRFLDLRSTINTSYEGLARLRNAIPKAEIIK